MAINDCLGALQSWRLGSIEKLFQLCALREMGDAHGCIKWIVKYTPSQSRWQPIYTQRDTGHKALMPGVTPRRLALCATP